MKKIAKILVIIAILIIISVIIILLIRSNKKTIVCIDAGHGGIDVGASFNERYEKDDTLKIAKLIKQYLEEQDIDVILTRDTDQTTILEKRCKIANNKKSDLFVSIHRNSSEEEKANGIEIWTNSSKSEDDYNLANCILENLNDTEIQENRGIKYGSIKGENTDYYILNNTNMPSCLVELGFISNENDNELLDKNIENYAKAIANGIIESLKVEK